VEHPFDGQDERQPGGEDQAFIEAIRAAPDDAALKLVYADWLEERGDERAEYLRVQVTLAQGGVVDAFTWSRYQLLLQRIEPFWLALIRAPEPLSMLQFRRSGSRQRPTRSEAMEAEVLEFLGRAGGKGFHPAARQRRKRRKMEQHLRTMNSEEVAWLMSGEFPEPRGQRRCRRRCRN
jgi:uncharacterized protein (TIGR02996 family)